MRKTILAIAIVASVGLFASGVSAQKVKLRDSGIKGHLTAGACGSNIDVNPCSINVDVPAGANTSFLYVKEVCVRNQHSGANVIQVDGGRIAQSFRFTSDGGTQCKSFDPAMVHDPTDAIVCSASDGNGTCSLLGIFGK